MSDPRQSFANRFLGRADGSAVPGGTLLQTDSDTFSGLHTTGAVVPVYTAFPLSVSLTTTLSASLLYIWAYVAWNFSDAGGGVRTANFRFRRNGVLIPASRATSSATAVGQIATNSFNRLLSVGPGLHTITFEWAKQTGAGTLIVRTDVGVTPNVYGANLKVQEFTP